MKFPLQEFFVSSRIDLAGSAERLLLARSQGDLNLLSNGPRNLILHLHNVLELVLERLGPQLLIRLCIKQLHSDAHSVPDPVYRPFNELGDAQLRRDARQRLRRASESQRGCLGRDLQPTDTRQSPNQRVLHSGDEIGLLGITREIFERQNGDRIGRNVD